VVALTAHFGVAVQMSYFAAIDHFTFDNSALLAAGLAAGSGKEQLLRALKITLFMIGRERECFEN